MERDEAASFPIARGGPVFGTKHCSELTNTSEFENALFHELEELKAALKPNPSAAVEEEDISLDDLKIFTDEELICEGMRKAFEEDENSSQSVEGSMPKQLLQEAHLKKVEELSKIRQRQKDARAAAKLHCLVNNTKTHKRENLSSEKEKLKSLEALRCPEKIKVSNAQKFVSIRLPETVLCIEVYSSKNPDQKTQEIMVLGHQKLTELRDAIHCLSDTIMNKAGQHDPSGYFLMEDIFYNDMRHPSAIDYSKPIFDWIKNSEEEALQKWESIVYGDARTSQKALAGTSASLPNFTTAEMHSARFCDLRFCLGTKYVYCHQGDCKHEMVIRDMRALHPDDCQNRAAYPLVAYQHKSRVQKCCVCQVYKSTYMTVDDIYSAENPCYYCNSCYYLMHYDENGNLRYDHTVHEYVQDI